MANYPRQSSFKKNERGVSQSPDDIRVASKPSMEETVAKMPRKRGPLFGQKYWQQSLQHPDNLHGNSDARREIITGDH